MGLHDCRGGLASGVWHMAKGGKQGQAQEQGDAAVSPCMTGGFYSPPGALVGVWNLEDHGRRTK